MPSDRYLEGQHAVVTGGSRGIGAAVARALVDRGAKVTIMSRSADSRRSDLDAALTAIACDVTDQASISNAFAEAANANGAINVLVNNAGAAEGAPFA